VLANIIYIFMDMQIKYQIILFWAYTYIFIIKKNFKAV